MKIIFLTLLFSLTAFAQEEVRLSYEKSENQAMNQVVFFVKKNEIRKWQNSNTFSSPTDVKLGEMKLLVKPGSNNAYDRLVVILKHFEDMDAKLKDAGKKWNDLVPTPRPHAIIAKINNYLIPEDSVHNKEIMEIMSTLLKEKTELIEGVELVKSNKEIQTYKDNKVLKSEVFIQPFHCDRSEKTQVCHIKKWGSLNLSL